MQHLSPFSEFTALRRVVIVVVLLMVVLACRRRGNAVFSTPDKSNPGSYNVKIDGALIQRIDLRPSGEAQCFDAKAGALPCPSPVFLEYGSHELTVEKDGVVIRQELIKISDETPELYLRVDDVQSKNPP